DTAEDVPGQRVRLEDMIAEAAAHRAAPGKVRRPVAQVVGLAEAEDPAVDVALVARTQADLVAGRLVVAFCAQRLAVVRPLVVPGLADTVRVKRERGRLRVPAGIRQPQPDRMAPLAIGLER